MVIAGGLIGIAGGIAAQLIDRTYRRQEGREDYFRRQFPNFAPLLSAGVMVQLLADVTPDSLLSSSEDIFKRLKGALNGLVESGMLTILPKITQQKIMDLFFVFLDERLQSATFGNIAGKCEEIEKDIVGLFNVAVSQQALAPTGFKSRFAATAKKYRFLFDTFVLLLGVVLAKSLEFSIPWPQVYAAVLVPFTAIAVTLRLVRKPWYEALKKYSTESFVWIVALVATLFLWAGVEILFISPDRAGWILFGATVFIASGMVLLGDLFKQGMSSPRRAPSQREPPRIV